MVIAPADTCPKCGSTETSTYTGFRRFFRVTRGFCEKCNYSWQVSCP